ncbi:MAG: radical SAM protein, partial [Candidatus Omnitrophica bacterium]|nr:radical SAM protein [Candidatus Omnitrophota bacterium]
AEVGFSRLADAIEAGEKDLSSINGLIWRDGANLITNPRSWVDDLDSLGAPAWDIIKPEKYPEAQHGAFFKKFPIAPIMVTRGCPFSCTFCAGNLVSGKKIRKRSIGHVLWEMNYLYRNHGIREFHIIDDNFTMDAAYVKEFLRRLKALNLDISWAVPNGVRMDTLDEEMLRLMKETGLYMISLGIETGSDRVLRMMRKATNISKIRKCVSMIQEAGIDIAGFFILGFPGETEMSIKKTICFARQLGIERANFFTYLPFPGTQSYRELEARGELKDVDWESFYFMNAAYVPQGLNRKQLKDLQRLAFARFYLRSRVVLYHIKEIKSLRHLMFLTRRFLNWIA